MSQAVISVEGLSKRYLIGHQAVQREYYLSLRDVLRRELRNFVRKGADFARGRQIIQGDELEEFWALKDVSFDVKMGEVIGVIGRNGAGKSTLLKILSRITEPSQGRVVLRGRVASLLEVGTGFHPELTGRENIYLNGAILGMTQREIRRKFDEIVSFAEVERFLDTPVKRYSSGMYVRLAFAVAAHLEPEILIIDEVLAVGDASFQEKCLGKMKDVAVGGRTVLFVSHNMSAVMQLTQRAIVLSAGKVEYIGNSTEAVEIYTRASRSSMVTQFDVGAARRPFRGTEEAKIVSLMFDRQFAHFKFMEPLEFKVRVLGMRPVSKLRVSITVFSVNGSPVGSGFSQELEAPGSGEERDFLVRLPPIRLAPGTYFCSVSIGRGNNLTSTVEYDTVADTMYFEVSPEETESGSLASWMSVWGSISIPSVEISRS